LLRLLHPLQDKVRASSGVRPTQLPAWVYPPSRDLTGSCYRLERRAVCTKGRDEVNAI